MIYLTILQSLSDTNNSLLIVYYIFIY